MGAAFSIASGSLSVSNGLNVTKMVLALMTVGYDLIFIVQHYCLYNKKDRSDEDETMKLQQDSSTDFWIVRNTN